MTSTTRFTPFALCVLTLISATTVFADVKVRTRVTTAGNQTSENTIYIKGRRQRSEGAGGESVSIMQCDLRRTVQLAPRAKTYRATSFDELFGVRPEGATGAGGQARTAATRGGTVTTTTTVRDTGERKQIFGHTARRLVITQETTPSPDACTQSESRVEIESWVIDAEFALACERGDEQGYLAPPVDGCQDRHVFKTAGTAKPGYPVYSKTTLLDKDGRTIFSSVSEVLELSKANLDAALFDVPADYREAKGSSESYAAHGSSMTSGARGGAVQMPQMPGASDPSANHHGANVNDTSNNPGATAVGAKKAGVIRLGLAGVKTGAVGEGVNPAELSAAARNTLAEYLKGPNVELVALEAKLPSAVEAEAKMKECDLVIYASVSHKKGGGGGMFGRALGRLSETVSRQAYGSSNVAGKAAQVTIMTAAAASGNVKAKDQLTLEVRLVAPGNASPVAAKQFQAKAKADGEDVITPLVEQAAQMIVDAAAKLS
jgi:hypothetical protein